jgi:hypothetical protein
MRALIALSAFWIATVGAAHAAPSFHAGLIAAAKATPVRDIDYDQERCDDRTVGEWLAAFTAAHARRIDWTAGRCRIVGPGIDAGSDWCVQATVRLAQPQDAKDAPMVEIFFEDPVRGRPGKAYAFRGLMQAADGQDMSRFRNDFEYDWISRFPAAKAAVVDCPPEPEPS